MYILLPLSLMYILITFVLHLVSEERWLSYGSNQQNTDDFQHECMPTYQRCTGRGLVRHADTSGMSAADCPPDFRIRAASPPKNVKIKIKISKFFLAVIRSFLCVSDGFK